MRRGFGTQSLQHLVNKVENPGEYCTRVICSVLDDQTRKRGTGVLLSAVEMPYHGSSYPLCADVGVSSKATLTNEANELSNRHHGSGGLVKEIAPVIDLLEVRT
jgi:hypothetical protein